MTMSRRRQTARFAVRALTTLPQWSTFRTGVLSAVLLSTALLVANTADADRTAEAMFEPIIEIDLAEDARRAAAQKKHLMIMFVKDGCTPCLKMKKDVLPDPTVQQFFTQHFLAYSVNTFGDLPPIDQDKAQLSEKLYARREGILGTPAFYFFDGTGRVVYKHTGFLEKHEFLLVGRFVAEGHYRQRIESSSK